MGIGDFISNIFGSTNKAKVAPPQVDPNAYHYGGTANGAADASANYTQQAQAAQGRQAPTAATQTVDYGQANADAGQGQQSRQGQSAMANVLAQRAMGGAPTIAQMQADRQMQQAQAGQASMAASARGAGALANAQRNAANNVADTQANISGQAQINGAQEVLNNTNAASAAYGNLRSGDQAQQGQDAGQAQFTNQSAVNQGQFNATQQSGQNSLNDAMTQNMTGNAINVNNAQLTASMNQQAQQSGNTLGAGSINAGVAGQNASMNQSNAMNAVGMAQSGAGAAAGAITGKATGGPVAGRTPYLVGEQGPELIVPKKDGVVIPAPQTQQLLAGAPSSTVNSLFGNGAKDAKSSSLGACLGMPAREDGGPVAAGGAPSTWGTGQPVSGTPYYNPPPPAVAPASPVAGFTDPTTGMPLTNRGAYQPLQKLDEDAVAKHEAYAANGALEDDEKEQKDYETAKRRVDSTNKADKKTASAERKSKLSSVLGSMGDKAQESARGTDTSYHGSTERYAPPALLALPARAMGGVVAAGGAPPVAEPAYAMTSGGGMSPAGTMAMINAQTILGPMHNPAAIPAREDGGPVDGGGARMPTKVAAYARERDPLPGLRTAAEAPTSAPPESAEEDAGRRAAGRQIIDVTNRAGGAERALQPGAIVAGLKTTGRGTATLPGESRDTALAKQEVLETAKMAAPLSVMAPGIGVGVSAFGIGQTLAALAKQNADKIAEEKLKRDQSRLAMVLGPKGAK